MSATKAIILMLYRLLPRLKGTMRTLLLYFQMFTECALWDFSGSCRCEFTNSVL